MKGVFLEVSQKSTVDRGYVGIFDLLPEDAEERVFICGYVVSEDRPPEGLLGQKDVLQAHVVHL